MGFPARFAFVARVSLMSLLPPFGSGLRCGKFRLRRDPGIRTLDGRRLVYPCRQGWIYFPYRRLRGICIAEGSPTITESVSSVPLPNGVSDGRCTGAISLFGAAGQFINGRDFKENVSKSWMKWV
jgi:hypothetical protein